MTALIRSIHIVVILIVYILSPSASLRRVVDMHPWTPPKNNRPSVDDGRIGTIENSVVYMPMQHKSLRYRYEKQPMQLTLRQLHKNCDGQCFYHSSNSSAPEDACRKKMACTMVVSIARLANKCTEAFHNSSMGNLWCRPDTEYYKVSMVRTVRKRTNRGINPLTRTNYMMDTPSNEFMAITWYTGNESESESFFSTGQHVWYACVANELVVTAWIREKNNMGLTKLDFTHPYKGQAPGILWSNIKFHENNKMFGCQFILSSREMHFREMENATEKEKKLAKFAQKHLIELSSKSKETIRIKFAKGVVLRNNNKSNPRSYDRNMVKNILISDAKENLTDVKESAFHIAEEPLDVSVLEIKEYVIQIDEDKIDKENSKKIMEQYKLCEKKATVCLTLQHKSGCIETKSCKILVIIRVLDKGFDQLGISIIATTPRQVGVQQYIRPHAWVSIGFSLDTEMGNDLTLNCMAIAANMKAVIGYNFANKNTYLKNADFQNYIQDKRYYPVRSSSTFMCLFNMPAVFNVSGKQGIFDFQFFLDLYEKEYYIFLATGPQVNDDWSLSYHTHSECLTGTLTRASFLHSGAQFAEIGHSTNDIQTEQPSNAMLIVLFILNSCVKYFPF